jgi:hypothetical protein
MRWNRCSPLVCGLRVSASEDMTASRFIVQILHSNSNRTSPELLLTSLQHKGRASGPARRIPPPRAIRPPESLGSGEATSLTGYSASCAPAAPCLRRHGPSCGSSPRRSLEFLVHRLGACRTCSTASQADRARTPAGHQIANLAPTFEAPIGTRWIESPSALLARYSGSSRPPPPMRRSGPTPAPAVPLESG